MSDYVVFGYAASIIKNRDGKYELTLDHSFNSIYFSKFDEFGKRTNLLIHCYDNSI